MFKSRAGRTAERLLCSSLGCFSRRPRGNVAFFSHQAVLPPTEGGLVLAQAEMQDAVYGPEHSDVGGCGRFACVFFFSSSSTWRMLRSLRTVTPLNPPLHRRGWGEDRRRTPSSSSSYFRSIRNSGSLTIRSFFFVLVLLLLRVKNCSFLHLFKREIQIKQQIKGVCFTLDFSFLKAPCARLIYEHLMVRKQNADSVNPFLFPDVPLDLHSFFHQL